MRHAVDGKPTVSYATKKYQIGFVVQSVLGLEMFL